MSMSSPSSAAYERYVSRIDHAIIDVDIFPMEIARIVGSYITYTRPDFYHFVLKNGNVMGVLTLCDKKHRTAFFADESLFIEDERKTYDFVELHVPTADRHSYGSILDCDKLTIDTIFESRFMMIRRIGCAIGQLFLKNRIPIDDASIPNMRTEVYTTMIESFAREADRLVANI